MTKRHVFNLYTLLATLLLFINAVNAQKVLNTTGATLRINDYNLSYSVGEMAIFTRYGDTSYFTEGVLQSIFALIPGRPLTTTALGRGVCLGENVDVYFSTSLTFNNDNEFTVELSDQNGDFKDSTVLIKVPGTTLKKIPVQIPSNLEGGKNYMLRVRSSSPQSVGLATNLIVNIKPTASFSIDEVVCTGNPVVATFTGKDTIANANYIWLFEGSAIIEKAKARYEQSFTWNNTTQIIKDTVRLVVDNYGCKSDTAKKVVTIEPSLAKPRLSCVDKSGDAITFNWSQVSGANAYRIIRATYPDTVVRNNSISFRNQSPNTKIHLEVQALSTGFCGFSRDTLSCATIICPRYEAAFATEESNICAGSSVDAVINLSNSRAIRGSYSYAITYTANGVQPTTTMIVAGDPLVFKPEQTTTYNITSIAHELYKGCSTFFNNLTFQVNVASNYSSGAPEGPKLVCDNQDSPILLNDLLKDEDNNGHWRVTPSINGDAFDPDVGTFVPKGQNEGTYIFTYTVPAKSSSCISRSSEVKIMLERKLDVEIKDYSNCLENGKTIVNLRTVARRVNRFAPSQVRWYYDLAAKDTVKQEQIEIAAELTLYAIVGRGKCGSVSAPVILKPGEILPTPKIQGPTQYVLGEYIDLSTSSSFPPGSSFVWKTPDTFAFGFDLYKLPRRLATKKGEGRYSLQVIGPQELGKPSCESPIGWLDVLVFSPEDPILKIDNIVSETTPWKIEGIEKYPNHKITIVNRWGRLVYQATGTYSNNWYGTSDGGKPLPQATYYYQIETGEPGKKTIIGALYLIR